MGEQKLTPEGNPMPLKPRSRTGCLTCRIRRVKCDETRPVCQKCQSTGRKCEFFSSVNGGRGGEGGATPPIRFIQHCPGVTRPIRLFVTPGIGQAYSPQEYQAIEFFHIQTAACFGTDISLYLRQAMDHNPTIRLAALAVGSLHRAYISTSPDDDRSSQGQLRSQGVQYALQNYSAAINRALTSLFNPNTDEALDVVLIACLLFFCFECLQGQFNAAIRHITSGLKILQQQQQQQQRRRRQTRRQITYLPQDITQALFAALENQLLEIDGGDAFPVDFRLVQSPQITDWANFHPNTIEEVQRRFELLYNRFLRLLASAEHLAENHPDRQDMEAQLRLQYVEIKADLSTWSFAFYKYLEQPVTTTANHMSYSNNNNSNNNTETRTLRTPREEQDTILRMKLWRLFLDLFIQAGWPSSSSPVQSQLHWDDYTGDFLAIITLVEKILDQTPTIITPTIPPFSAAASWTEKPSFQQPINAILNEHNNQAPTIPNPMKPPHPTFCVPPGIIPPLWVCATRSRHSIIRHRAIELLAVCNRREGIWDSRVSARVAARIVEIEEDAAGIVAGGNREGTPYYCHYSPLDVPESARIIALSSMYCEGRAAKVRYIRPLAGDGEVEILEESINW